ncbi:homoserine kinase [Allofranklinella schreckenbergeri]|uniref:Homoserine kinase n=1 Tax=Allofranklinella schreckenbergeri TaxID=1076744 RepID=A0A3M6PVK3_9BURK|nr:homoserine kinase [Allofranklinella schreckenbergeri]RMW94766.1 homoserine kinase [Allofranklinella schreckenbergeri]
MAVYTEITPEDAQTLLTQLDLGPLLALQGISGGIENTNYFVTTPKGEFVLTLFERLTHAQLPFYLQLTRHLAQKGIAVPAPQTDAQGELLFTLKGKPAAVVEKLEGQSQLNPQPAHCAQLGQTLARMHLAAQDYPLQQPNLRGLPWWNATAPEVLPHLNAGQTRLLESELAHQNAVAASAAYAALPRSAVHADLFRDNVMFVGERLSGVFDFYFAGVDTWMFDLGIVLNDWCIDLATGAWDPARVAALWQGYQSIRPITPAEQALLPDMLRAAALRFWISRLWDFYLPRQASILTPHDPKHFERILHARIQGPLPVG